MSTSSENALIDQCDTEDQNGKNKPIRKFKEKLCSIETEPLESNLLTDEYKFVGGSIVIVLLKSTWNNLHLFYHRSDAIPSVRGELLLSYETWKIIVVT